MGDIANTGTVSLPYFSVATLTLLLLRAMGTREPSPPQHLQDDREVVAQQTSQEQEPVMQSVRFDERPNAADLALADNYTASRLARAPSLCELCRCVHSRPANFRLLLIHMTAGRRGGRNASATCTAAAAAAVSPPAAQRDRQRQQQVQGQEQQQVRGGQERRTVWKSFKKAVANLRRRIQRLLNLPQRRQ